MSGALGAVASLISRGGQAISGAQSIASGIGGLLGFGSTGPVALGGFVFADFEIPASIAWGGQQQHTVHKLPGGGRVIDAMGRDDRPVAWSGIFLGSGAETRALQLDAMKNAGRLLTLTWGAHSLQVLIASFEAETKQVDAWIPYQITCTVASINATAMLAGGPQSLLGAISSDIGQAATVVQNGLAQAMPIVGGAAQIANAAGIRVPLLNSLQVTLASASGVAGTVGSTAATAPAALTGALAAVQGITTGGLASSGSLLARFNASTPANATAAVQAITAAGDAASAHAEANAVDAFAGQGMAAAA